MNIKVSGMELSRMMKVILQCIDTRTQSKLSNICVTHKDNALTIRGTNGQFTAVMSTPLLGGDGESFCVDGGVFAKVCGLTKKEVSISTNGKDCVINGAGRTRIPIVNVRIPEPETVSGSTCFVKAEDLSVAYGGISHAISSDQARVNLTGVHTKVTPEGMQLTALDGFQLAREIAPCDGDPIEVLIPGAFMKLIDSSTSQGETITFITDGKRIQADTEGMLITSALLANSFPNVEPMIPESSKTEILIKSEPLCDTLKASTVVNNSNRTVRLQVGDGVLRITNNCEQADYEADVECDIHGADILLAFNQQYILNAINSVNAEEIVIRMNTTVSPVVITKKDSNGFRILTPVRTGAVG